MFNVYESTSSYTFDLGDRITQIVDSIAGTTVRQYDGLDDLTDEQTAQGEVGYFYDKPARRWRAIRWATSSTHTTRTAG